MPSASLLSACAACPRPQAKDARGPAALSALAAVLPSFPPARRAALCAPLAAACAASLPAVLSGAAAASASPQLQALAAHALPSGDAAAAAAPLAAEGEAVWGAFAAAALDAGDAAAALGARWWDEPGDRAQGAGEALAAAAAACCAAVAACGEQTQEAIAVRPPLFPSSPFTWALFAQPNPRPSVHSAAHSPRCAAPPQNPPGESLARAPLGLPPARARRARPRRALRPPERGGAGAHPPHL